MGRRRPGPFGASLSQDADILVHQLAAQEPRPIYAGRAPARDRPDRWRGEPPSTWGMTPMDVIIYHNPRCGTSRNTLGLIRNAGVEPHVIEYLKTPPSRVLIRQLVTRAGVPLRALLRDKEPVFRELGLNDSSLAEDALLDAIEAHPILLNRPI